MASKYDMPLSLASVSIGLPHHTLEQKLKAISSADFCGLELGFPDLQAFATQHFGREIAADDYASLCAAGKLIHGRCRQLDLEIIVLQPFTNFEGWPEGSREREEAFARARGWIEIMSAVGTDTLQVGSSDSPDISSDVGHLARDLAQLADMLAERGFRLAYENWCWATHAPGWKDAWTIVRAAGRPNIGLCLDTFQSAGGEWADPTTASGLVEQGGEPESEQIVSVNWKVSLSELMREVPAEKIYFLQISDAYRMDPPMDRGVDGKTLTRPRGRWSHDYRPLPYDGGYLPIVDFLEAVMATGFRGWLSVEVFDGQFEQKFGDDLDGFAVKAKGSVEQMLEEVSSRRVTAGLE